MKVNFTAGLKDDKGILVFLCTKNKPLDKYLENLNTKLNGYINKAIKVLGWKPNNSEIKNIIETAYNFEKVKNSLIQG